MSLNDDWNLVYEHGTSDFADGGVVAFQFGGGKYVAARISASTTLEIMSSGDPEGPWTYASFDVGGELLSTPSSLLLAYGGGVWVAAVLTEYVTGDGKGPYHTAIITSTDPTGSWTRRADIVQAGASPSGVGLPGSLLYHEGTWVLGVWGGRVMTASDPTGTWSLAFNMETVLPAGTYIDYRPFVVARVDGEWVAAATSLYSDTAYVWSSSALGSGWTQQATFSIGVNDRVLKLGEYPGGVYLTTYGSIFTAAAPAGTWSETLNLEDVGSGWSSVGEFTLSYADGDYILWFGQKMATSSDPAGPWESGNWLEIYGYMDGLVFVDDEWVAISHRSSYPYAFRVYQPNIGGDGWGVLLS